MFKKISVLLPTRGRVANLQRLLQSMRTTITDWSEIEILFRCDDDDIDTIAFLRGEGFDPIVGPRFRGYVSMPIFLKELFARSVGDVIFPINDDGEFFTKDWPKIILAAANRYPDGIFNFGAETGLNSYIHPFPIMSRQYVEALGHIGNEELYWIDVYQLDICRAFDRVIELRSVVYKHYWFEETQANPDATRKEAQKLEMEIVFDINKPRPDKPIEEFVYEDVFWNWRDEYKKKHDEHVQIAVNKLLAAVTSGKFGRSFGSLAESVADMLPTERLELGSILTVGQVDPTLGGIADLKHSQIASVEEAHYPELEFAQRGERLICAGDISDFNFLTRVAERVGQFNTLLIWGPTLARCVAAYFVFRRQMAFPGTVLFVSCEPGDGVERFVKNLAAGTYDQTRHEFRDVPLYRGHIRVWAEVLRKVPNAMPAGNRAREIPARKTTPPRPSMGFGTELVKSGDYNIVKWLGRFYALPRSVPSFQMEAAVRSWEGGPDGYIVGDTLEEVEAKLPPPPMAAHPAGHGAIAAPAPAGLLLRLKRRRRRPRLKAMFDADWYLAQYPDVRAANADPLRHFLHAGASERRSPHPLFDSAWYLAQYPDVAAGGSNPLEHYIRYGAFEGRDPNPLFASSWYLAQYPDVTTTGVNPLLHYIDHGAAEGRDPSPGFDSDWYLSRYPDVAAAGTNPLAHYLHHGRKEGRQPSAIVRQS